jgi:hypothetical protein
MADSPRGAIGLLVRDCKGKEADRLVTHIDPGVVSLVAELRRPRAPGGRGTGAVERETRGPGRRGATDRDYGQVRSTGRSATE